MRIEKIALGETGNFSPLFLDYLEGKKQLNGYYGKAPVIENFKEQIENKSLNPESRGVLHEVLKSQYQQLETHDLLRKNIDLLKADNTYTITTGHQLNIFTGPLYFIYKIVTVINICKQLKGKYPDYNFIPVYWMATEDHDFAEINHFNLFGKKYEWETDQKGAVGRFNPASIKSILDQLPEHSELFEEAYLKHGSLADATRYYVNALFGKEGLVVIDADNAQLKGLFRNIIKDDLFNHRANDMVESASSDLAKEGYRSQVYPRSINFFYLENGSRERIIREDDSFVVRNTDLKFSKEEIEDQLEKHPDRFSPNVITRPLYQETVLPNLAYIGGPAEIAYWLQLKRIFDYYKVPFPILMPRNFALVINKANVKKIKKLGLGSCELFLDLQSLKTGFIERNSESTFSLEREREILNEVYQSVSNIAAAVDKSLEGLIGAEANKALKGIENIEKRLKKAEEKKQETALIQLQNVKEKLFPGGGLQERIDNFLNFYFNNPEFIEQLCNCLDPFDYRFNIILEDETSHTRNT
ncbi:bacillithiol biosynthesis cysteine-adding enzyme BshC [Fulvivirgaceae bacterium BMA10]|uniref:Putative cysteine ligase BshC n=1 Tax=Splendidivirga corallicola TaxID=3051826 RepID=A0ABT8KIQ9_9BACT|nr:bacillithiol biosynthesis cysteine-adding enzyme BshC [Fulvivirgaceae bacterium BMA10]